MIFTTDKFRQENRNRQNHLSIAEFLTINRFGQLSEHLKCRHSYDFIEEYRQSRFLDSARFYFAFVRGGNL
jgi:hypothetical protein